MPPMLAIWRSTITRSGGSSATAARASGPEATSQIAVSEVSRTAMMARRTDGASLATTMVGTGRGYPSNRASRQTVPSPAPNRSATFEEAVSDELEARQVVDVGLEQGDPTDRGGRHLVDECGQRGLVVARRSVQLEQVVDQRPQIGTGGSSLGCDIPAEGGVDPVHHERRGAHAGVSQLDREKGCLLYGVGAGGRDHDVGGRGVRQQGSNRTGS